MHAACVIIGIIFYWVFLLLFYFQGGDLFRQHVQKEKPPSAPMNLFLIHVNFYTSNMNRKLGNAAEQNKRKLEIAYVFTIRNSKC